jgi:LuxR family maltose regulon positive regulatory protein
VTLTPREHAVLLAAATFETVNKVAESQFVSVHTVRKQLASVYRKLGVTSRADALARARELGLL